MKNNAENFEEKLKKAEQILLKLDEDDIDLQTSIKLHNEGKKLLDEARDILENTKLNIISENDE